MVAGALVEVTIGAKTKRGQYFGKVCHPRRRWNNPRRKQMAYVRFRGKRGFSTVPYDNLKFI